MKNVLVVFLVFGLFSCQAQTDSSYRLDPEGFEKGMTAIRVQILDVRTAGEYASGHIKNALQADWTNNAQFIDRVRYIDKDRPVFVYCLVGGRSSAAATWMRNNGFSKVVELKGGINAWKSANKPLEGQQHVSQMTMQEYLSQIPADKITLVDFGAPWCPPCVKMIPVIDSLQNIKDPDFLLLKVDAGVHTDIMKDLHIGPIPVFIIYKNGKETWRKEGLVSREELLNQLQ